MNNITIISMLSIFALSSLVAQAGNTVHGVDAGTSLNGGIDNTFIGEFSGNAVTTATDNTFVGSFAGASTILGDLNTFMGSLAGGSNSGGTENLFLGTGAGFYNASGHFNTFVGTGAGFNNITGSGNVFIGYTAGFNAAGSGSNKLYIDSADGSIDSPVDAFFSNAPLIYGEFDNRLVGIDGILGVGTQLPTSTLHVTRADGTAKVVVEETNATVTARTLFELKNKGNTKFNINNIDAGVEWSFANSGNDFRISRQGSGNVEFKLSNAGDLTIQGNLTELSSREAKHNIIAMNSEQILNKVLALPINEWSYKDSKQGIRHIGPMAEDFHTAFGLGESPKGIATLDTSGVALAAIQGLNQKVIVQDKKMLEKDAEILALKTEQKLLKESKIAQDEELDLLQTELTQLKELVQRLAAKDQWASLDWMKDDALSK